MANITSTHIAYLAIILIILILMLVRKDIILPCIIGIFVIGVFSSRDILKSIQILYTAVFISGKELWQIILIISLIISMARALDDIGADIVITKPLTHYFKTPTMSFWIIGFLMMFMSFFIWPAPSVGLIGAILISPALKSGLDKLSLASVLTVFGFGIALSGDFFIQAAPSITAKAAELNTTELMIKSIPTWAFASIISIAVLYITTMKRLHTHDNDKISENEIHEKPLHKSSYIISIIALLFFISDILVMYLFKIRANAATALIGGTAILILVASSIVQKDFLNKISEYLKSGFLTGIRTFAPIIVISAFFFLGETNTAKQIIGPEARGYLMDIGMYLSKHLPLNKYTVLLIQLLVGGLTGLSGSGFSGLPLIGALSKIFSDSLNLNVAVLASVGQISAIWVGGGTIIPWSVVPVSAVLKVDPTELANRNIIPVISGLAGSYIIGILLL